MGAFDVIAPPYRCHRCNAQHGGALQTKFFRPDLWNMRTFESGVTWHLGFDPAELAGEPHWERQWLPLAPYEPGPGRPLTVLADFDELWFCTCGEPLLPQFSFALAGDATTAGMALLEVRTRSLRSRKSVGEAHFCDHAVLARWRSPPDPAMPAQPSFADELLTVLPLPSEKRIDAVHASLMARLLSALAHTLADATLYFVECLWCAPSWRAFIGRTDDGQLALGLAGTAPGRGRVIFGDLDTLLASIWDEADFADAVSATRGE